MQKYLEHDEFVDKVYEAVKIIGDDAIPLIEEHLNIHFKDGKCCCPFHQENTPSFVWNPKTKNAHCFGCNKTYNIVNVLVDKTGSHKEALNELFRMAHMEVNTYGYKPFDGGRTDWFANYKYPHPEHEPTEEYSIKYLNMRGISKQTIDYAEVKEDSHGNIAFEYRDLDNKLLCVKYRASHKLHKGEAKMWFQKDASTVPILYNVKKLDYLEPLVITEGECFPPDAEILTPNGWVRFDEYNNEQVMQYNEDGTGEFVTPLAYIKHEYNGELWEINKAGNYYTCTTPNHNIVYVNKRGETIKRQLSDMPNTINGYIPRVLSYNGSGLNLSDDEIRLQVAFSADGSFNKQKQYTNSNTHRISFSFTKERKAIRLKEIMDKTGIQYTYTDNPNKQNRYYIGFTDAKHFLTKEFNFEWLYKMNTHQREVMIEEIQYWDGYSFKTRNQSEYYSVIKNNVDFVQTLCHTTNRMSTIKRKKHPSGFSNVNPNNCQQQYTVSILHGKQYSSFQQMNKYLNKYMYAGFVYCVQVPSGMILVRQHEKITVIGNCDALSVIESGYTNVCSVPNGAGSLNWVEFNYDFLQNFNTIILYFDNDPAGQEGLNKIIPRIGEYRCKIVKPTSEDEQMVEDYYAQFGREGIRKTDANNILLACGKQRVIELINRAEEIPVKNLKYLMDCEITDIKDVEKVSTGLKGMDDILFGNLMSCFTIYTGRAGSGKSSLCNLTSIIAPIEQGHRVFVFSGELSEGQLLDWIMSPLAGLNHLRVWDSEKSARKAFTVTDEAEIAIRKYYHDNIILYSAENELATSEEDLVDAMETAYRKYGCDTFVIDNLMTIDFTTAGVDNKYEQQKKFITRLMNFTNTHNVNISCVSHPKKVAAGEDLDIYSLHGASELSNLCHRLIAVKRLTDDEEGYSIECQIIKDRPTQAAGKSCKLMYDTATRRIYSTNEELSQQFSWEKSSNINYPDAIKKNLLCNRKDVLATIPKIVSYSAECDQY